MNYLTGLRRRGFLARLRNFQTKMKCLLHSSTIPMLHANSSLSSERLASPSSPSPLLTYPLHYTSSTCLFVTPNSSTVADESERISSLAFDLAIHGLNNRQSFKMAVVDSSKMRNWRVRDAVAEDIPDILQMIKDLAVYEKKPETVVKISEEVMLRDGFGENPRFGCLIAEEIEGCSKNDALPKKRAVGYAIFFHTYSTWKGRSLYMEDLYVNPACRGKGIGTEILKKVSQIAVKKECVRLDWNVLYWNKVAVDFYDNLGAERLDELRKYRLSGEQLIEFAGN